MRRSRAEEPLPAADRWLLSWADFVTLLLALFAAMYAGASMDLAKAKLVAQSVGAALGAPPQARVVGSADDKAEGKAQEKADRAPDLQAGLKSPPQATADQSQVRELADALRTAMAGIGGDERVRIVQDQAGVSIDIDATLLFATGTAMLSPEADVALQALASVLLRWPCKITVEGHTDSLPIHTAQFGSNWELSAMRAAMVARRLAEHGIIGPRLSAVGRADTRPLADNESATGRARNRRVHLLVTLPGPD